MSREHRLDASRIHHDWDRSREPALVIRPGDIVQFELPMAGARQVFETSTVDEVEWDFAPIYNLGGPIFVEGASRGDTLEVEILELKPGPWGWATIIPGLGLLGDDFSDPYLKIFDLRGRTAATVAPGIEVPVQPFLGTMGVPTDEPGRFDCRHLIAGSTLWLPVWCEGALFSCGDPHAAQGDGEVCVTAIECGMEAALRFRLGDRAVGGPEYHVPQTVGSPGPYHGTMGIDPDLMEGARKAVRNMISWLVDEHGLTGEDAYILCSLAGDLRIHEIVDAGVWNVGMTLPLAVFDPVAGDGA